MMVLIEIVLSILITAVALWGSIKLLENGNDNNTFGTALLVATVFTLCSYFGGYMFGVIFLVALFMLLVKFYDLGFLKSIAVVVLMGLISTGMSMAISVILPAGS